jgi:hypothetical protein
MATSLNTTKNTGIATKAFPDKGEPKAACRSLCLDQSPTGTCWSPFRSRL